MRIALLSDVHGNADALEAVLADVGAADGYWFLGDLVAHGPRPAECVRRLRELPGLVAVRGNTDRYTLTSPPDPVMVASFEWTRSSLSADDLTWLGTLPLEARPLDDVLMVHASPGRDDGPGLDPHTADDDLVRRARRPRRRRPPVRRLADREADDVLGLAHVAQGDDLERAQA